MTSGAGAGGERKLALITGASRGIGEAFAHVLAKDGCDLVIVARSEGELHRVSGVVGSRHEVSVVPMPFDLCVPQAGSSLAKELEGRGLKPDIIVNNAGFGLMGPAASLSLDDQLAMVDVNIRVLTDLSLRFLSGLLAGEGRRGIINVASLAALAPGPNMAVYYASKAYVLSFSEALAAEVSGRGVTVTAVCPGMVPTGFQARAGMEGSTAYKLAPRKTAQAVAEAGWAGFQRGDRVVFPGASTRLAAFALQGTPHRMSLPLMRLVLNSRKSGTPA
jgi:short-subunit dehydrogenase